MTRGTDQLVGPFTPLLRASLASQVVDQLRTAIAQGRYGPGDALPSERQLVALLGVSRVVVREALMSLQAQGVVERAHGRAARVAPARHEEAEDATLLRLPRDPTEADVHDVKQARMALEMEVVRLAALSIDEAGSICLRAALQANRDAISDSAAFLATDMALHSTLAGISGNRLLNAMNRDMLAWLARYRIDVVHLEGSDLLSYREHAGIVEGVLARDPGTASRAMYEHLSRSHLAYGRLGDTPQGVQNAPASADSTPRKSRPA